MGKVVYQKTLNQTGEVIESWAYIDSKGIPRFITYNRERWVLFCRSAGIDYIEKLEVKDGRSI